MTHETLDELAQRASAHFASALGQLDPLPFRQREGLLSTQPLSLNAVAAWRTLDTSSVARCFPFSPPDLDTRSGALYGIDMRACAPIVYDPWDGSHLNANTAVLARSGSGKSFATKLGVLRRSVPGGGRLRDRSLRASTPTWPDRGWRPGALTRRGRSGHEPVRARPLRSGGAAPADRFAQAIDRGDGGRTAERRAPSRPRSRPGRLLRPALGAHRLPRLLLLPGGRRPGGAGQAPAPVRLGQPAGTCSRTRATTSCTTRRW